MIEDFIDALRNFSRAKTRTFLSLLGVIIGVASVIVITSMGSSSTKQIQATFGSSGLDLVSVSSGFMRRNRDAVTLQFDEPLRQDLFDNIENVKKVWYKNSANFTVSYGETSVSNNATAIEPGYLEMCGLALDYGEYFSVTDEYLGAQKMILGSEVAAALFPEGNAVGKGVLVVSSSVPFAFRIVGVLKEQTSGMESSTTGIYVPRGFYAKKIKPNPTADTIMVQATDKSYCTAMVTDITNYMTEKSGTEGSVYVMSMQTMIDQMSEITSLLSLLLSGIAAISLLVGGIGIMNIMIVTVTERRQEIGIRKALGASPFVICRQFLVESASITVLGGILGILLGIGISFAVEYVRGQPFSVQLYACLIAFIFSVFVGIFFGFSPARRAAKLDPVEALAG
ncbi:ABC transporter permease [Treponema zioleckii]|uniref:ABC transporter permease n=1 Tax=Treponema zioleckii TaxID=331680 RepID=UPI00168A55B5|nr:ABC transporter permease [Treponema zioleckii]